MCYFLISPLIRISSTSFWALLLMNITLLKLFICNFVLIFTISSAFSPGRIERHTASAGYLNGGGGHVACRITCQEYDFAYIPEVITLACFKKSEPNDFTALQRYIAKRVEYPEELRPWGVSGRVSVTFIVDADGSVKIDKVLESPHPKMSYRVKKIILSTSGKWTPATYFGVPIQQRFNIPVDFRLR